MTEESVQGMKQELIELQPQLEESTRQTEAAMVVIAKESAEADKVKQVVSKEEAAASTEAAKVKAIKDDCEADLAVRGSSGLLMGVNHSPQLLGLGARWGLGVRV